MGKDCISIIIPVYQEQQEINKCLDYLDTLSGIDTAEVIIVDGDNGSTIHCIDYRSHRYSLKTLTSRKGRGRQLHHGAAHATCLIFLFLHVDTRLHKSALTELRWHLAAHPAGAFDLYIVSRNYLVRAIGAIASLRSRITRIPYGDQAHFMTAEVYFSVGGYPAISIMEDVALMARVKRGGIRVEILKQFAKNPDRRWKSEGVLRSTFRNWYLRLRYQMGADTDRLARLYKPQSDL